MRQGPQAHPLSSHRGPRPRCIRTASDGRVSHCSVTDVLEGREMPLAWGALAALAGLISNAALANAPSLLLGTYPKTLTGWAGFQAAEPTFHLLHRAQSQLLRKEKARGSEQRVQSLQVE